MTSHRLPTRLFRAVALGLGGLLGALAVATVVVMAWSEMVLRRRYVPEPQPLAEAPPALVAQGHRLARLHGCLSCHGEGLAGNHVFEAWPVGDIIAPNLTKLARQRTDAQLTVAIRQGIAPDGRGLLVMTSDVHARMAPEETAALIAWLRSLPVRDGVEQPFRLRPLGRLMLLLGDFRLQPVAVKQYRALMPPDLGIEHAEGRRLAASICAECHGPDLGGGPAPFADFNPSFGRPGNLPPDLSVAAAYDLGQFRRLLRTGVPISGRDLGIMSSVARRDLSHLTDREIEALHGYLVARARRGASS
ncbi:MAG: c-type cytochrome [Gemmatimonadales bacterium]|nr:c-type cytochrome [Gemmatimonadales bacterium]